MKKYFPRFLCGLICIVLLSLVVVACGSKVNQVNFNKIQTGMAQKEVNEILGSPTESSSVGIGGFSGTTSKWVSKEGTITVQFLNEKVVAKQFIKTGGQS